MELGQKVLRPRERLHLDVDGPDLLEGVGVGSRAGRRPEDVAKRLGARVGGRRRTAIEDLDDVELAGEPLDGILVQGTSRPVVWMLQVHQAALVLDALDGLVGLEATRNCPLEKEPDQLAFGCEDLLADHDRQRSAGTEGLGSGDGFVVRQKHG